MPFCDNCGNKVSESSKFCSSCGQKVTELIATKNDEKIIEISEKERESIEQTKNKVEQSFLNSKRIEENNGFKNIPSKSVSNSSAPKLSTIIVIFSIFTLLLVSGIVLIVKNIKSENDFLNYESQEELKVIPEAREDILSSGLNYKYDAENIIFKNNSNNTAYFKIAYFDSESNEWKVVGWYEVMNGQEFDFNLDFYNFNKIYWIAENGDSSLKWHGNDIYLPDENGDLKGFFELILFTGTTYKSITN